VVVSQKTKKSYSKAKFGNVFGRYYVPTYEYDLLSAKIPNLKSNLFAVRAAANAAEALKTQKYADMTERVDFKPFAAETLGAFGTTTGLEFIDSLASRIHAQTGELGIRALFTAAFPSPCKLAMHGASSKLILRRLRDDF